MGGRKPRRSNSSSLSSNGKGMGRACVQPGFHAAGTSARRSAKLGKLRDQSGRRADSSPFWVSRGQGPLSVPEPAWHTGDALRSPCMASCLNRDVIGECPIGQKIAKTKQRHKTHAHKRSAMVNGVVAGAGSLKHASGHTGPRRVGGVRRGPPFLRGSCCEHCD